MVDDKSAAAAPVVMTMVRLRERHSDLMREYGTFDDEPTPEFIAKIIAFQTAASAAGIGISSSDERFEAQSKISYWQTARINAGQRPATVLLADFDQEEARRQAGDRSPYKGLAPFLSRDSKFFAGRYELVGRLVAKVKAMRLLALTGLSGSGKSSVVRAGLIPDLADGAYDGIDDDGLTNSSLWKYPEPILPGADPLQALQDVYGTIATPADLPAALDRQGEAVVLSIDQFEEVFTLSPAGDRRTLFLDALVAAATSGTYRHVVVITMRSEFDTFVESHAAFGALFTAGREVIQAMQASDLRKVIEEPANRLGVGFEPGLVDELLTRVQGEPAGLPLLSFTLLKLWEMRAGGAMKMADYQALGGNPRDILANSADAVFGAFLKQDQDLARGIFTRLVKIGDSLEATSMRITRADLDVLGARDNVNRVLDILVDEGLLRTSPAPPDRAANTETPDAGAWITPETQIEVAHEALIRNWGRLTQWVKDSFAEQTNRKAFALRAQKWGEGNGDLLSGMALDEAKDFPEKTPIEIDYIDASQRQADRRQRRIWAVTAVIAFLFVAASVLALLLWRNGLEREAKRRADIGYETAVALVDRGEALLAKKILLDSLPADTDLPPRVRALLEAASLGELEGYHLRLPQSATGPTTVATEANAPALTPETASILPTGWRLLSVWNDGRVRYWNRDDDGLGWQPDPFAIDLPDRIITAAALSPDGFHVMTASLPITTTSSVPDGQDQVALDWWDISDSEPQRSARRHTISASGISTVAFNETGDRAVLATTDGDFLVIDASVLDNDKWVIKYRSDASTAYKPIASVAYSSDGARFITAAEDGWVEIFDAKSFKKLQSFQASKRAATSVRFSPNGLRFAVGSADGVIRIFQTSDGQKFYELAGHRKAVTGIAISGDGATLISSSDDGTVRFWELGIGRGRPLRAVPLTASNGRPIAVKSVSLSENDTDIVVALADGSLRAFDVNSRLEPSGVLWPEAEAVSILTVGPDRSAIVAQGITGMTPKSALIDTRTGKIQALWTDTGGGSIYLAALSAKANRLVFVRQPDANGQRNADNPFRVEMVQPSDKAKSILLQTLGVLPLLVAVSPDGTTTITVDQQGQISGFDATGKRLSVPLQDFRTGNGDFDFSDATGAFSVDGPPRFALSIPGNPLTFVYDLTTGKIMQTFKLRSDVTALQFVPDRDELFIGIDSGAGALFNIVTGQNRPLRERHDSGITFATFAPDGRTLVTGSYDSTARIWDVASGALLKVLKGHSASLTHAVFAPDGKRILTESDDRTVRLWDVATGQQLTTLRGPYESDNIWGWFASDGKKVQTISDFSAQQSEVDGRPTLRTWKVGPVHYDYDNLRAEACAGTGRVTQEDIDRSGVNIEEKRLNCSAAKH